MKAIDRLYIYLEYKQIKPTRFEQKVGFSSGYLSKMKARSADMGESQMNIVLNNCPDMNKIWFICGEGNMLNPEFTENQPDHLSEPVSVYKTEDHTQEILSLHRELLEKSNRIIEQADIINKLKEELATLRNADGAESRIA